MLTGFVDLPLLDAKLGTVREAAGFHRGERFSRFTTALPITVVALAVASLARGGDCGRWL